MTEESPQYHGPQNHCFGCGPTNSAGLKLSFESLSVKGEENHPGPTGVVCLTTLSELYEGPPGYLHGGIIATLLDEAMSKANRAQGVTAMTRQMQVDYLRPVPSNAPIRIEGQVTRSEGRKHWTSAKLVDQEGILLAQSTGLFIAINVSSRSKS